MRYKHEYFFGLTIPKNSEQCYKFSLRFSGFSLLIHKTKTPFSRRQWNAASLMRRRRLVTDIYRGPEPLISPFTKTARDTIVCSVVSPRWGEKKKKIGVWAGGVGEPLRHFTLVKTPVREKRDAMQNTIFNLRALKSCQKIKDNHQSPPR